MTLRHHLCTGCRTGPQIWVKLEFGAGYVTSQYVQKSLNPSSKSTLTFKNVTLVLLMKGNYDFIK